MSGLIVIAYNDIHKAEEFRLMLQKLPRDYLADLAMLASLKRGI